MKFTNSFFPKMAKKYENLPRSCRSKADPDLFKDQLRSHLVPIRYKFLSRGSKLGGKRPIQIRVGRSLLNSHGYTVGKSLSPQCPCHFPQESPSHYFLDCFLYTEERRSLLGTFEHFIPDFIYFSKKKKLETILFGHDKNNGEICSTNASQQIATQTFILKTKRFSVQS